MSDDTHQCDVTICKSAGSEMWAGKKCTKFRVGTDDPKECHWYDSEDNECDAWQADMEKE